MEDNGFVRVNGIDYASAGIANGLFEPVIADKIARITARPGYVGEEVITYSQDGIKEKHNVVKLDPKTGRPSWIVTKVDSSGNVIFDELGHDNSWIIEDSAFAEEYIVDYSISEHVYKSIDGAQVFVPVLMDIILEHSGGDMRIEAGGWLNITDMDDIYGISQRDFEDTYRIIEENLPKKTNV